MPSVIENSTQLHNIEIWKMFVVWKCVCILYSYTN